MKILIAGSDGYIGTRMGPFLMSRGHTVTGLDTGFYRNGWLYNPDSPLPTVITKDTRHVTVADLTGYDVVVHLADLSNDPLALIDEANTYKINHIGSYELAKKAKQAGVSRFVYSSSCSIYGVATEEFVNETSEVRPQTAYAKCKLLVEKAVAELADDTFTPTYLRNSTVYGPSPRMRFDLVLNNLSALAYTTREIKMTSDGTPWRPLVHIMDLCEAFAQVIEAPKEVVHNQIFNVGSTKSNYQVKEIATVVAKTFPDCTLSFGKSDGDTRSYRVSFDKIAATFPNFQCTRTIETGAAELLALFQKIHLTPELFADRAYTRLKQLSHLTATNQVDAELFWRTA